MSAANDFERTLATWLERDGPSDVPERVITTAFAEARTVRQRRAWLPTSWLPTRVSRNEDARTSTQPVGRDPGRTVGEPLRLAWIVALVGLLAAAALGAAMVGSALLRQSDRSDELAVVVPLPSATTLVPSTEPTAAPTQTPASPTETAASGGAYVRVTDATGDASPDIVAVSATVTPSRTAILEIEFADAGWAEELDWDDAPFFIWVDTTISDDFDGCKSGWSADYDVWALMAEGEREAGLSWPGDPPPPPRSLDFKVDARRMTFIVPLGLRGDQAGIGFHVHQPDDVPGCLIVNAGAAGDLNRDR